MKCRDDEIKVAMKTDIGVCMMIIITALCVLQIGSISFADTRVYNADSTLLFNRSSFPPGFIFGLASSAYQSEGAAFKDGKGASIWDTFTHQFPEKIADRSNGDVANNFYYLYKEDVKLLKFIGVDTFRMSISWSRILPRGKLSGGVNKEGISFYNNVFNELLANGIFPFVTIFHGDLPQALEDEYGGFLSPLIIDDFRDFAELCFKEFGDRVKYWITLNEPYFLSIDVRDFAPNRCSNSSTCSQGNSATDPYIAAHYLLLSHAATVELYKKKYQGIQRGKIGITLNSDWFVPSTNSKLDVKAAQRALDFMYGWFVDPVVYGNYPRIMQSLVGNRLPNFTKKESAMLKGSFDFLGLNYYTARYASNILKNHGNITSSTDSMVRLSFTRSGVPIGEATGSSYFYVYPKGLHDLLVYVKEKYNNPTIYITENGIPDSSNSSLSQNIKDQQRINFYNRHLQAVRRAIREGVNVKSFIAWTFTDDFEWQFGYTIRFGFFYVDYKNGLKRIPKQSFFWFKSFLNK